MAMNPRRCVACWECVEKCPKQVIGKVGFLWHRHATFKNADACIGCNKCMKTCPRGVFFKPDEAPLSVLYNSRTGAEPSSEIERLLPLVSIATAVSGIVLHISGQGTNREVWHTWDAAHGISGFLWLVSVSVHLNRHGHWYRAIAFQGVGRKSRITLVLSAVSLIVVVTGIVSMVRGLGPNSAMGLWHYWFGLLWILFSLIHIAQRKPWG